jgi:hypothetical protein
MFSNAEGWDFTGSSHANQCFGVYSEERGSLCGTKERFEDVGDGAGNWWSTRTWYRSDADLSHKERYRK